MFYLRYLRLRERPDPEDAPERLRERVDLLEARLEQEVGQEARLEQLEQRLRDLENNSRQEDSSHRNQLSSKVFLDLFVQLIGGICNPCCYAISCEFYLLLIQPMRG